jgi:hypothetical protein
MKADGLPRREHEVQLAKYLGNLIKEDHRRY